MWTKNSRRFYFYRMLSFVMYATPLAILFGLNCNEYISSTEKSLSFFGYIVAIFLSLSFKSKLRAVAKKNTLMTISVVIFVVALIMQYLANQLLLISFCSMVGCILSTVFEKVADSYKAVCYKDGIRIRQATLPHRQAWVNAYMGVTIDGQR